MNLLIGLFVVPSAAFATPFATFDLELDDGGFVESGETGQWDWGDVRNGPGSGFDGQRAWSTGLINDYLNDTLDHLEIPVPDLSEVERPTLSFQHWFDIASGDYAWLEVNTGNGWIALDPLYGYPTTFGYTGASGGWRTVVVDLSDLGPSPRIRLAFEADLSGVASGWTIDCVAFHDGDAAAPKLSALAELPDTENLDGPYTVTASAVDDTMVAAVTLGWSVDGVESSTPMVQVDAATWSGSIPAQPPDTEISYWVEATDGLNESREPVDSERSFRVYLPAPTALVGPEDRIVGLTVPLSWAAPVSAHAVLGYEVLSAGQVVVQSPSTSVDAPLSGGIEDFSVRAVYAEGVGDASDTVSVDGLVPGVEGLTPAEAWPGDTLRVQLSGFYLLLAQDDVGIDLGAGVDVTNVDVRDVDTAYLELVVSEAAAAGARVLTLTSGDIVLTVDGAFEVLSTGDRPRLTGIEPAAVRQGDTGVMDITLVGTLAGDPTVDLGEGVLIESVEAGEGTVTVHYVVTGNAPLGERLVSVDDGVRTFDGVLLDVKDGLAPATTPCGTPLVPGVMLAALGLAVAGTRRRS